VRVVIVVVGLAYPLLIYAGWRRWREFEVGGPELAPKPPNARQAGGGR